MSVKQYVVGPMVPDLLMVAWVATMVVAWVTTPAAEWSHPVMKHLHTGALIIGFGAVWWIIRNWAIAEESKQ